MQAANTIHNVLVDPNPSTDKINLEISSTKEEMTFRSYLKEPNQVLQNLISISTFGLLFFSLAIIYQANYLQNYHYQLTLSKLLDTSNLTGLMYTAIIASILSFTIWLTNSRAWRIPSLAMTALTFIAMISFVIFTASLVSNANYIHQELSSTNDVQNFALKMANVDYRELQDAGCPAKYLFNEQGCADELVSFIWENHDESLPQYGCLNTDCAENLARVYTGLFFNLAGWASAAIVCCLLLTVGGIYSFNQHWLNVTDKKSSFNWLGALVSLILIFLVVQGVYKKAFVSEFVDITQNMKFEEADSQFQGEMLNLMDNSLGDQVSALWLLSGLFGPKPPQTISVFNGLTPEITSQLTTQVLSKLEQYAVLKKDPTTQAWTITKGSWDNTFAQFANEFDGSAPRVGLINLKSGVKNFPVVVIHDSNAAGKTLKEMYNGLGLTGDIDTIATKGVVVYATSDASQITQENLLNKANSQDVPTSIMNAVEETEDKRLTWLPFFITYRSCCPDYVAETVRFKKYQFMVLRKDLKGIWQSVQVPIKIGTPLQFSLAFIPTMFQVGFIHLDPSWKLGTGPVVVIYDPYKTATTLPDAFKKAGLWGNYDEAKKKGLNFLLVRSNSQISTSNLAAAAKSHGYIAK